jgi:hypothetical protein
MFNKIGFLAFVFAGMTLLNRILEGAFITASDVSVLNTLTLTRSQEVFGLFTMPVLNMDFFFTGIPRLVKWDYSYFGGNAAIFQYFLYSLTFALSFMIFAIIVGMVSQYFARR